MQTDFPDRPPRSRLFSNSIVDRMKGGGLSWARETGIGSLASMSHWPLTQSVQSMDGFEFALFVLWSIILFLGIGYATDYLLSAKGMGPHWNAACAALGAYLGLCAHDWWFRSLPAYEPELTIYMVLTGLMAALTSASVIAMRR